MSWDTVKTTYTQQKDAIFKRTSDKDIESLVGNMNAAIQRFTNSAGISTDPASDPNYTQAEQSFKRLVSDEKEHMKLNQNLSNAIKNMTESGDLEAKLKQVGTLRDETANLEKELHHTKQDLETSKARQHDIETPRRDISYYQGFAGRLGFTKPLQVHSIPFLVGFGLLCLFFSGLLLKEFFKPVSGGVWNVGMGATEGVGSFFTDSRFYAVLGGISFVGAVLGVLAYSGAMGKNVT
jgi:hypothetical protein